MIFKRFFLTIVFLISASSLAFAGKEIEIHFNDVPKDIMRVAQELLPEAKFFSANTEEEIDGTFVYEIQGTLADNRKVEVDIHKNGEIEEFEVEFTKDMVPGAVISALKSKMPGFVPIYIEASHSASKKVMAYEFVGTMAGSNFDVDVSADGRKVEIADQ